MDVELISRTAAIARIDEYLYGLDLCISELALKLDGYRNGLQVAIQELKALPAVDAVPIPWLIAWCFKRYMETEAEVSVPTMIEAWWKEQEGQRETD